MWVQILLFNHLTTPHEISNKTILRKDQISNTQNINRVSIPERQIPSKNISYQSQKMENYSYFQAVNRHNYQLSLAAKSSLESVWNPSMILSSKLGIKSMHTVDLFFDSSQKNIFILKIVRAKHPFIHRSRRNKVSGGNSRSIFSSRGNFALAIARCKRFTTFSRQRCK